MSKSIGIAVAPVGGWGPGQNNPLSAEAAAQAVLDCAAAGAAVYHIHSRDIDGNLTTDLSVFRNIADMVAAESDIILEASTGGLSPMSAAERALPLGVNQARMGSLNMGSLNFGDAVYSNSLPDIRFWISLMAEHGVIPALEIFDTGHLETTLHLISKGILTPPYHFSFIFNVSWGMTFEPGLLEILLRKLPEGSHWGAIFAGNTDFAQHLQVAKMGADLVRVGFEDSLICNGDAAETNAQLVERFRSELESCGYTLRSPGEVQKLLKML